MQEARIKSAVEFLQQPRVVYAGRDTKIKYLQEKCKLTADELDTAFKTAAKELETKEKGTAEVKKEETSGSDFGTGEKKAGEANGGHPCPHSLFLSFLLRLVDASCASLSVDVRTLCTSGYGTVAVDLASEQATLKALRKQQMDKPPPVAMKKNPETVRNLTAHSQSILAPECLCSRGLLGVG